MHKSVTLSVTHMTKIRQIIIFIQTCLQKLVKPSIQKKSRIKVFCLNFDNMVNVQNQLNRCSNFRQTGELSSSQLM